MCAPSPHSAASGLVSGSRDSTDLFSTGAFDSGGQLGSDDDEFGLSDDSIGPTEVESVKAESALKEAEAAQYNPFDISDAEQYVVRKEARAEEDEEDTNERATLLD